jgi:hypothetical protein
MHGSSLHLASLRWSLAVALATALVAAGSGAQGVPVGKGKGKGGPKRKAPAAVEILELDDEPAPRKLPPKKNVKPPASPVSPGSSTPRPAKGTPPPAPAPPPPAPSPVDETSDTETFGSDDLAPALVPAAPATPVDEERFELSGWTRFRASLMGEDDRRAPADPLFSTVVPDASQTVLPYDRVTGDLQGYLRARYRKGKRFEAVVAASASWSAFGNAEPTASAFAGLSSSQPRTSFEAVVREGWLGVYRDALDLRIGLQRISWGKSDAFTPNDVVNARDVRDPFLTETALQRLPTVAIRADIPLGTKASLQLHVSPFFTPDAFDLWGSNGALIQPSAPASLRYLLNRVGRLADPTLRSEILGILGQTQKPRLDFTEASGGARLGWEAGGFDGALYAHYGFHTQPYLRVSPDLPAAFASADLSTAGGLAKPFLDATERGAPLVLSTYVRRVHLGFDVARAAGPFVLKIEGAYDSRAPFLRSDFSASLSPVAQGVFGIEWQPGENGTFVLLETNAQQWLDLGSGAPTLFIRETTVSQAALVRHTFREHFEVELRAAAVLDPRGYLVRPQISWKESNWDLRAGLVWLDGDDGSYASYYARNTQGYLIARGKF